MTYRAILVTGLLSLIAATQSHALMPRNPLTGGPGGGKIYVPPTWVPPPGPPSQPGIMGRACSSNSVVPSSGVLAMRLARTAVQPLGCSITVGWVNTGTPAATNTILRSVGQSGPWTALATVAAQSAYSLQQFVDSGLSADTMYCYVIRAENEAGTASSPRQCVYSKDGTGRSIERAQIRIHTGTPQNADADVPLAVLLNSATSLYAVPSGNKTWIDYSRDDFERGANDTYDLALDHLGEIGDINMISIQKDGGDAWCLADFELIVNGASLFSKSFASQPGGCLWLADGTTTSNMFTVSFAELRATPGWYSFDPQVLPTFTHDEIVSRIESLVGNAIHGTKAYWPGANGVTERQVNGQTAHVDVYLAADVTGPNPSVHIQFDLVVSGGCQPDGSMTMSIVPANVQVNADLGILDTIGEVFLCTADASDYDCITGGVEDAVANAVQPPSISASVSKLGLCDLGQFDWSVKADGAISLL